MKVIKKGPENEAWGKELVCKGSGLGKGSAGCGALLLVAPADVLSHYYDGDTTHWFVCPDCGVKTYVKSSDFK